MIKNYTLLFYRCFLLLLTGIGITARGAAQNLKWLQTAGSSAVQGGTVNTTSVAAGNDGTFFITGDFRNTVDLDPGPGMVNETATYASQNLFLANMDASGKLLFEKTIKGSGKAVINKIVTDRQHHLWLTGSVEGTFDFDPGPGVHNYTSSGQDAFLAQFDDKGNLLWFGGLGEAGKDAGTALWADDQNNIYLGGYFSDHIDLDPGPSTSSFMTAGPRSLFLAKFNENAGFQFGWILESSGSNALSAIETDANGHIHLLGNFQSVMDFDPGSGITSRATAGASDIFLAEYDAAGTFQSVSTFGGIGTDLGTSMRISSSTIYLTGSFEYTVDFDGGPLSVKRTSLGYSDLYLAACDLSGNLLWVHTAGGSVIDRGTSLTIDPDNNIYLTGSYTGTVDFDPSPGTYNLTASNNSLHAYLSKYDAGGHFIYARSINGSGTETTAGIAADLANHLFLCGSFTKTADFDPGPASQPLTAGSGATGTNGFFGAYSFDGEWISSGLQGGYDVVGLNCEVLDVVTDAQGNSYQVGVFNGTVDFDPGPETVSLKSNGSYDVFLSKYDASGKLVFVKSFGSSSDDRGYAIGLDKNGHIIIAGYFYGQADFDPGPGIQLLQSNNGTIAGFFSQFDTDGNFIYARVLLNSDVLDLAIDPGNNIILSGEFLAGNDFDPGPDILQLSHEARGYNSYISKYDNTGKLLFARALGGTQQDGAGTALAVDKAGSIYVSGYFFGSGDFDPGTGVSLLASLSDQATVFLGKFDASGNYIYAKSIGNTGQVWPGGLALNDGDEPYLLTYFTDKATFGTGSGAVTLTDERATGDIALARYDADGNFLKVTHISGDNLQAYRILVDPAGSVTMMGWSHGVIDRDPGAGESLFTSTGSSTFILRLSADDAPEKFISMGDHGAQVFGYALAAADGNRILVAGWYYYDQEADAGHQSIFQQSTSSVQGFLAKWSTRELQDIAWPELFVRNYVAAPMDVPVSASSGLPIHYSSSNERVANVSNGKITITGVGETTITASQEGNEVYEAAVPVVHQLVVMPAPLTVKANDAVRKFGTGNPVFTLVYSGFKEGEDLSVLDELPTVSSAAGSSTTPGHYPIVPTGGRARNYEFMYSNGDLTIEKATQTIAFPVVTKEDLFILPTTLRASASSGLPITYSSSDPMIATIMGNELYINRQGTVTVTAFQPGSNEYEPARASQDIQITGGLVSARAVAPVLHPNPVQKLLTVLFKTKEQVSYELFDAAGSVQVTARVSPSENLFQINVANLPSGLYFLRLKTVESAYTLSFIKQ